MNCVRPVSVVLVSLVVMLCGCDPDPDGGDAGTVADGGGWDAGTPGDAGAGDAHVGPIQAEAGARCPYQARAGLVVIGQDWGAERSFSVLLSSAPAPWLGPPALTDSACVFHQGLQQGTCACQPAEVCSSQDQCVAAPTPVQGISLSLVGAADAQQVSGSGDGTLNGVISLTDPELGVRLAVAGWEVVAPAQAVPPELAHAVGTLTGSYDAPRAVDVRWDVPVAGAEVYSHTNINHHVGSATFTECVVPAASGLLHIDGAMLTPLSVATGLEFQGVEHVRFAAAATPLGCVEFRWTRRQFVSLGY